jgi:hypothetical protein
MKRYLIRYMAERPLFLKKDMEFDPANLPEEWANLEEAELDQYVWDESGYTPRACARVGWNEQGLHVLMYAREDKVRARVRNMGGMVCTDSCLEFFVKPAPEHDARYFNFEVNARGVMLLEIGTGRKNRFGAVGLPAEGMNIQANVREESAFRGGWWAVSYTVPAELLAEQFPGLKLQSGLRMEGNFYTCADLSDTPHYGSWNRIDNPFPDYHRPEGFGELVLAAQDA